MAFTNWYSCAPLECAGEEEAIQALARRPYFMLKCSNILGASFVKKISKEDISDITTEGYLYFTKEGVNNFVLHKHCLYLLGVFDSEKKRVFQQEYNSIKEKSKIWLKFHNDLAKIEGCITYQNIVKGFLSSNTDEYRKSFELLTIFNQKFIELKIVTEELEKEIEAMIHEYILKELRILFHEAFGFMEKSFGINIQGTLNHYLEFFINKKYYKYI